MCYFTSYIVIETAQNPRLRASPPAFSVGSRPRWRESVRRTLAAGSTRKATPSGCKLMLHLIRFLEVPCWLVVSTNPSEKWWSSSLGMMTFPIYGKTNSCSKPPISKFRNFKCDYEPINHITSWHNWRFISFISNNHRLRGWYQSTPEIRDGLSKGRQL